MTFFPAFRAERMFFESRIASDGVPHGKPLDREKGIQGKFSPSLYNSSNGGAPDPGRDAAGSGIPGNCYNDNQLNHD